ncbi:unnamed protein product [Brassicogethes aeneus]|uniref:Uncharacterized protein n=1 Tax=Brassicogethes aeneus TaxID=1431903 RepID=A0A9P0BJ39_BRAAE|nr:unnamed protein product [Brassicogethes aeneus]
MALYEIYKTFTNKETEETMNTEDKNDDGELNERENLNVITEKPQKGQAVLDVAYASANLGHEEISEIDNIIFTDSKNAIEIPENYIEKDDCIQTLNLEDIPIVFYPSPNCGHNGLLKDVQNTFSDIKYVFEEWQRIQRKKELQKKTLEQDKEERKKKRLEKANMKKEAEKNMIKTKRPVALRKNIAAKDSNRNNKKEADKKIKLLSNISISPDSNFKCLPVKITDKEDVLKVKKNLFNKEKDTEVGIDIKKKTNDGSSIQHKQVTNEKIKGISNVTFPPVLISVSPANEENKPNVLNGETDANFDSNHVEAVDFLENKRIFSGLLYFICSFKTSKIAPGIKCRLCDRVFHPRWIRKHFNMPPIVKLYVCKVCCKTKL